MKKIFTSLMLSLAAMTAQAAEPNGYYSSCEGKTGEALLKALADKVGPHTKVSYDGLWEVYKTSDMRPDGTLWDMYSTKEWPANFKKCGNYKLVGDCVNREHSFPKSWWGGGQSAQYSDAYHLYPTDGKVNGQRSAFPFGECEGGTYLAANGNVKPLGRLGTSTFPGYSGKVFEPDDMYKGDFARTYFYMAAAYNSNIASWSSDMLAGNKYPVYKTWAVNLLLKWSRQDPVSEKEINRNEAVSAHQKNRNPFIDHPELVEYIWGNKVGVAWYVGAADDPKINVPADGSLLAIGTTSVGITRSLSVTVKGTALSGAVKASVSGTGFSVTPATLNVNDVNGAGATITVSYNSAVAAAAQGTLTLSCGDVSNSVRLTAEAVDGLPAGPASDIDETQFMARWSCIDAPDTPYTIVVKRGGEILEEYPAQMRGGDEKFLVEGLEPSTLYSYTIASPTITSKEVMVRTLDPQPSIEYLYDGNLDFAAVPGEPSEIAEILMFIENIGEDITISVAAPFQVSTDKQAWKQSVVITAEEDRFYLRLLSDKEGEYSASVIARAGEYYNDDLDITGVVSVSRTDFFEDFENAGAATYSDKTYVGNACSWSTNALFEKGGSNSYPHTGEQAARTPKNGGYLTMLQSKTTGIGMLSVWARLWRDESTVSIWDVQVSDDAGQNWETVGTIEVKPNGTTTDYDQYEVLVNRKGAQRLRLMQTQGGRTMIDDIAMTNYSPYDGIAEANAADYHSWDAFCRGGKLVIESDGRQENEAYVYSADGVERFAGVLPQGTTTLDFQPGLYIVVVRDFSRRVLVK